MASVRRFGSCSSCQFRNSRRNGNERRWSAAPEWLLGSRIKAQGEEEDDWRRGTGAAQATAASQAGVRSRVGTYIWVKLNVIL